MNEGWRTKNNANDFESIWHCKIESITKETSYFSCNFVVDACYGKARVFLVQRLYGQVIETQTSKKKKKIHVNYHELKLSFFCFIFYF